MDKLNRRKMLGLVPGAGLAATVSAVAAPAPEPETARERMLRLAAELHEALGEVDPRGTVIVFGPHPVPAPVWSIHLPGLGEKFHAPKMTRDA